MCEGARRLGDEVADQVGRGGVFVAADGVAGEDVSAGGGGGCDRQRDGGVLVAGVVVESAGACDVAEAAEVVGLVAGERGGAGEAVTDDGVGQGELGHFVEVGRDLV